MAAQGTPQLEASGVLEAPRRRTIRKLIKYGPKQRKGKQQLEPSGLSAAQAEHTTALAGARPLRRPLRCHSLIA